MASSRRSQLFIPFVLGLLLMAAYNADAFRICSSISKHFSGPCKSNRLCATVCHHEKFTGGYCSTWHSADVDGGDADLSWLKSSKCMCNKQCGGKSPLPPPGRNEPEPPPGDGPSQQLNSGSSVGITN